MTCISESTPWFADISNYLASVLKSLDMNRQQLKWFFHDVKRYFWDDPFLYKLSPDQIIRRCIPNHEIPAIFQQCHAVAYGGILVGNELQLDFRC